MDDTSAQMRAVHAQRIREMAPWQRLRAMSNLIRGMDRMVVSEIRRRQPQLSEDEVRVRVVARRLPPELMIRAYGYDPRVSGY